jgi:hypothetical protein
MLGSVPGVAGAPLMLSQIDRLASECEDRAYLLRNIKIDIGGC